jgi:hypothetical protein
VPRRKVHLSLSRQPVMTLGRKALRAARCVYILGTNKHVKYPNGRSRVVYIGTTKRGARRVASSVAYRAEEALERRGTDEFCDVYASQGACPHDDQTSSNEGDRQSARRDRYRDTHLRVAVAPVSNQAGNSARREATGGPASTDSSGQGKPWEVDVRFCNLGTARGERLRKPCGNPDGVPRASGAEFPARAEKVSNRIFC